MEEEVLREQKNKTGTNENGRATPHFARATPGVFNRPKPLLPCHLQRDQ